MYRFKRILVLCIFAGIMACAKNPVSFSQSLFKLPPHESSIEEFSREEPSALGEPLSPFERAEIAQSQGNYEAAIQLYKLQIDSLPQTHEAALSLVKLKGLESKGLYEKFDGNLLEYLNGVTNSFPSLLIPAALVSAKILEGEGYYGDVIDIFDYLLSDGGTTTENVVYQAFSFYLTRMGDIKKAAKLLSTMRSLDLKDQVALQSMENEIEFERDRAKPYAGELLRSGIYHIGAEK